MILQDFMDVEYIPLETTDEFICQGFIQAIGKDMIIAKNRSNDGNIYIYNREGKALRKINRKGQGDEDNSEIFVNDMHSIKILVYDLEGNFRRSLRHKGDFLFFEMFNFDRENLICHDAFNDNNSLAFHTGHSFMLVSKQDGSITKEIQIPFKEKKSIVMRTKDETTGMTYAYLPSCVYPIIPYFNNYLLMELSADTLYTYSQDHTMKPAIVRVPSVQSMMPEVFLLPSVLTDRYYFMGTVKKEYGFPGIDLVYDKKEKTIFKYTVYNNDYSSKEEVYMKSLPGNEEIASILYLEAPKLVEDHERGRLKGRLKEIAASLDEESNPVIMLIKHKK